jgi:hypothetical protein
VFQNPAAIAYVRGFRINISNLDLSTQGATMNDLLDDLKFEQGSITNPDRGAELLRKYARDDTRLVLTAGAGIFMKGMAITAGTIVDARLLPNEPLRNWARTSGDPNQIPDNSRGDIIAVAALSLPDVTTGMHLPIPNGELAVGVRVRRLQLFYTHYFADAKLLRAGGESFRAPELGDRDFLEHTATGVDLGFLWKPSKKQPYTFALVAENLVEPNIRFDATNRNGETFRFKPLKRVYHVGMGAEMNTGTLLALDMIDVGNNAGRGEVRLGLEQRIGTLALRTGYASKTGWTAGLGFGGFNIAYSESFPITISRTMDF